MATKKTPNTGYKKDQLLERAIKATADKDCVFVADVIASLGISAQTMYRIAVIGSRSFTPSDSMFSDLLPPDCIVISGGAIGVDRAVSSYCKRNNIKIIEFFPDYAKYGKSAPIIRNKTIIDNADEVLAFWDGKSKGTLNAINTARKAELNVTIISI